MERTLLFYRLASLRGKSGADIDAFTESARNTTLKLGLKVAFHGGKFDGSCLAEDEAQRRFGGGSATVVLGEGDGVRRSPAVRPEQGALESATECA